MSGQLLSSKIVIVEEEPKVRGIPSPAFDSTVPGGASTLPFQPASRERVHSVAGKPR